MAENKPTTVPAPPVGRPQPLPQRGPLDRVLDAAGGQGDGSGLKNAMQGAAAEKALNDALSRMKSAERPTLSAEQRRNLINGAWQRLSSGESIATVRDGILAGLKAEQQTQLDNAAKQQAQARQAPISASGTAAAGAGGADPNNPYGVTWENGRPSLPGSKGKGGMSMAEGWSTLLKANLAAMPDPKDPAYKGDLAAYRADMDEWQKSTIDAQQNARISQQLELGLLELPDGTILDVHDPAVERDPALQAQMATFWVNQDNKVRDAYNAQLNALDLQEYAGATAATNANNTSLSRGFQDAISRIQTQVSVGQANQDTAVKQIDRILKGQQENRLRAGQADDELQRAAGYASPDGKTSFSPNDLGSAHAGLAGLAGLAPDKPLLNFTGQRTVDPLGMMSGLDAASGVNQPLPEVPGLGNIDAVPTAPSYAGVGAGPQLRRPTAPVLPNRPQAPATQLQLQSVADQMGP